MDKETKARALDKLRMFHGDYPHNTGSNMCRGDGYFMQSIIRDFGMPLEALAKACGYKSDKTLAAEKKLAAQKQIN